MSKRLKPYETVIVVGFVIVIFYTLWALSAQYGDVFIVTCYPLYIAIILGFINTVKYRHQSLYELESGYIIKEIKLMSVISILLVLITLFFHESIINAFLIVVYLLALGFAFNAILMAHILYKRGH